MYHKKVYQLFYELEASIFKRYGAVHNNRITDEQRSNLLDNLERKLAELYEQFDKYIRQKGIFQYNSKGKLIAIYLNAEDACNKSIKKSGLSQCLNGALKSYKGFVWTRGVHEATQIK